MPAYKDTERNTWYALFYYTDWKGEKKRKKKRGFKLKKEAQEYEREFLSTVQESHDMRFDSFVDLYINDMRSRLRESTMDTKLCLINSKVLPYFKDLKLSDIKATTIRQWQNELLDSDYEATYIRTINNQLSAIFNYGVKYYDLPSNPCHKAGTIGKKHATGIEFWTLNEFKTANTHNSTYEYQLLFKILFWTGIRIGEMFALNKNDFDFDNQTLSISKSLQRLKGKDIITEPKTPKGNRVITLPKFLCEEVNAYFNTFMDLKDDSRLTYLTKGALHAEMNRVVKSSGMKKIRVHDLRHSHASLVIDLGFNILLLSERLGHEKIETTLNTYSHLYPDRRREIADKLEEVNIESHLLS